MRLSRLSNPKIASIKLIVSFLLLLVSTIGLDAQITVTKIKDAGTDNTRINYVVLSEGYTTAQLPSFVADANGVVTDLFNASPFKEYTNFFNVHAIEVPSNEAGADHPGNATDVSEPISPIKNVDTYFDATFDYFSIHRLLVPTNGAAISTVLANNYPAYDQVVVLVGDTEYGGSGGTYATTSINANAPEIAIHEIGHSFANLADEYYAGDFYAGERDNMTAESNPALVKWADWVGQNGVGVYQHCCGGNSASWYRPHQNCKMRILGSPFCSVCTQRLIDRIYELVTPLEQYTPLTNNVDYLGSDLNFSIVTINPQPNTLKVEWLLDGLVIATDVNSVTISSPQITSNSHLLVARITDETSLSKSYAPASGYIFEQAWTINDMFLPTELITFEAIASGPVNQLSWRTASELNSDVFIIERSKNGEQWETIGEQKAAGNSTVENSYRFMDYYPFEGINYYRLKEVDLDNILKYSPVRQVTRISKWFYKVYPNPTSGPVVVEIYTNKREEVLLEVFDTSGKRVINSSFNLTTGYHQMKLDLDELAIGSYWLKIKKGSWMETVLLHKE